MAKVVEREMKTFIYALNDPLSGVTRYKVIANTFGVHSSHVSHLIHDRRGARLFDSEGE